jgi:hypothetical protein
MEYGWILPDLALILIQLVKIYAKIASTLLKNRATVAPVLPTLFGQRGQLPLWLRRPCVQVKHVYADAIFYLGFLIYIQKYRDKTAKNCRLLLNLIQ